MVQKRIDFFGGFEPSAVGSGAVDNMNALAGLGRDLSNLAIGVGNQKAYDQQLKQEAANTQAVKDGKASGVSIGFDALTSGEGYENKDTFFIGAEEQNALAEKTYVEGSLSEGEMGAKRIMTEFPQDRESGMTAYRNIINPMLGATNVPENAQISLANNFLLQERALTQFYDISESRIALQESQQTENNIAQSLANTALMSAGNNNTIDSSLAINDLRLHLEDNNLFGNIETRENFIGEAESQVNVAISFAQIDQGVLQNPLLTDPQKLAQSDSLIADLKDFDIEMDLTVDQRYQVIKKAETATNRLRSELKAANTISKAEQTKRDSIANVENFQQANKTGYPVGYVLPDKDVNVYYTERFLPQVEGISDPNQLSAAYVDFANMVGRVPTAQKQDIMASLNSGDPVAINFASKYIDDILGQQGINTTAFSNQEIAYALTVNTAIEYGAEPLEAIARARKIYDPQSADTVARRNAELNSDIGSFAFDLIGQELQSSFGENSYIPLMGSLIVETDPLAYDEMKSDYIKLSKQLYLAGTEDYPTARKTALKMIQANWTKDANPDGFGLMKYNPNGFYGVGGNKDVGWVRDIAHEELQSMFPDEIIDRDKITLTSNIRTAKEASSGTELGQPTYALSYVAEDGTIMSPLMVDNNGRVTNQWSPIPEGETKDSIMVPANKAIMDKNADISRAMAKETTSANWSRGRNQVEINFRNDYEEQGYSALNAMAMAEEAYINWLSQDGMQQRLIKDNSIYALIGRGVANVADGSVFIAAKDNAIKNTKILAKLGEAAFTRKEGQPLPQFARPTFSPALEAAKTASDDYIKRINSKKKVNEELATNTGFVPDPNIDRMIREGTTNQTASTSNEIPDPQAFETEVRKLAGQEAIDQVEKTEGALTELQKFIVGHEGFAFGDYDDQNNVSTSGVGQTGKYKGMTFKETFKDFDRMVRNQFPDFENITFKRQQALMSLIYRGDTRNKDTKKMFKWTKLFNEGKYAEAAVELLDHAEYKDLKINEPNNGVVKRLEEAARFIKG